MRQPYVTMLALLALGCTERAASVATPVVYGADDRTEPYAHPSAPLRAVAESAIAVQIHESWIDATDPSDVRITYTQTLGEAKNLCSGERFADQIEPGTCSGTLVDDRHILTAGHCMEAAEDCAEYVWVLGFRYASAGVLATLTEDDVYRCSEVVAYFDDGFVDHAFVRLDRPVVGHAPAMVRPEPAGLANGTPVALIGHPNGIPMKIDSGGVVTSSSGAAWLTATVDAFSGNSGSGVFDAEGRMVAILRGGETDYVDAGGCNVVNVIDPPPVDDGESLTYVSRALDAFCATGAASPLCGTEPLPGDRCADAEVIEPVTQTIAATLAGYSADDAGSCGGEGPERSYAFTLTSSARVVARASGFDTVLYLRDTCAGTELACNDDVDTDTDRGSRIELVLDPGSYVLFADAYDASAGAFSLELTFEPLAGDPDASVAIDAGTDAGVPAPIPRSGGCGCGVARPRGEPIACLVLLVLLIARRRSRKSIGS